MSYKQLVNDNLTSDRKKLNIFFRRLTQLEDINLFNVAKYWNRKVNLKLDADKFPIFMLDRSELYF